MVRSILKWIKNYKINRGRSIPDSYFKGYRRLADEGQKRTEGCCGTCKHAVAFVTWHCDLNGNCEWEPCYSIDEITLADYQAGCSKIDPLLDKWINITE